MGSGFLGMSKYDFYITPRPVIPYALELVTDNLAGGYVVDAGAGDGRWGQAAKDKWKGLDLLGVELREEAIRAPRFGGWITVDFTKLRLAEKADAVIGNPPFNQARGFIHSALLNVKCDGWVVYLLPLSLLATQRMWKNVYALPLCRPKHVRILSRRISFEGYGGDTNMSEYAIYVWQRGYVGIGTYDILYLDEEGNKYDGSPERERLAKMYGVDTWPTTK